MSDLVKDLQALLVPTPGGRPASTPKPVGARHSHLPTAELPDFDGQRGELTVRGDVPVHDWQEVLKIALPPGFDPEDYVLVGTPRVTSHTVLQGGQWENVQAWWKIAFARRDVAAADAVDEGLEQLHAELSSWKLPKGRKALEGDAPFVVNLADWQFGQLDAGGSAHTVRRLKQTLANVLERVAQLKAAKVNLGDAVVAGLGDLVEGCIGFYAMQSFGVDLDRREQINAVRRIIIKFLKALVAAGFEQITVVAVGGNHGEHRLEGKAFTTLNDNDDVAVFEQVYDAIRDTPHADRFRWLVPTDELALTVEIADRIVGFTHGHLAKVPGATPQKKLQAWWEKQAMGRTPVGDAHLLVSAHYHHFSAVELDDGRWHLQTPALCGTSEWWHGTSGQSSLPGLLTFVVEPGHERPFRHLDIVGPRPLAA